MMSGWGGRGGGSDDLDFFRWGEGGGNSNLDIPYYFNLWNTFIIIKQINL